MVEKAAKVGSTNSAAGLCLKEVYSGDVDVVDGEEVEGTKLRAGNRGRGMGLECLMRPF